MKKSNTAFIGIVNSFIFFLNSVFKGLRSWGVLGSVWKKSSASLMTKIVMFEGEIKRERGNDSLGKMTVSLVMCRRLPSDMQHEYG